MTAKTKKSITDEAVINQFISNSDLPHWFRGLSNFQFEAVGNLLNSLRDDNEQGTTHRVRLDLTKLGITPVVTDRKLRLVIQLCRGDTFAFLWFLMELYYTPKEDIVSPKTSYTVNEQIIICAIAHLDILPTLRELNLILPKPKPKPKRKKTSKKWPKLDYNYPYFMKQTRPVSYGKKLTVHPKGKTVNLGEYDHYLRSDFFTENECTRWFEHYKLNPNSCPIKRLVGDPLLDAELSKIQDVNLIFCSQNAALKTLKSEMLGEIDIVRSREYAKCYNVSGQLKNATFKQAFDMIDKHLYHTRVEIEKLENNIGHGLMSQIVERERLSARPSVTGYALPSKYGYGLRASLESETRSSRLSTGQIPVDTNGHTKRVSFSDCNDICNNVTENQKPPIRTSCTDIFKEQMKRCKSLCGLLKGKSKVPPCEEEIIFPKAEDIDPYNAEMMNTMLLTALNELKKNRKYVLASLPDAHKFPILKEWIKRRYGLVYTMDEKRRKFKKSAMVFRAVRRKGIRARVPVLNDLGTERNVSYDCKNYLVRKSNDLREKYYDDFKNKYLYMARIYWSAACPFLCSKGPPRNELFAYLPSRVGDVHMFRPWRPDQRKHASNW